MVVFGILFATPFIIPLDLNYGSRSLDGLAYLDTAHPADAGAVAYLQTLTGNERIVEAEGGDYTYYSTYLVIYRYSCNHRNAVPRVHVAWG